MEGGYQLPAEDLDALISILEKENPDVVISSMRGDFQAQYRFHETLADWLGGKAKRLLFISTANVFDGDMSQPWTEEAQPNPGSDYGKYKRDCEAMLEHKLSGQLIIFRIPSVWAPDCPRMQLLREHSASREPLAAYPNDHVNVTLTDQVGACAKYVLDHDLKGIFHIGSRDTVDYATMNFRKWSATSSRSHIRCLSWSIVRIKCTRQSYPRGRRSPTRFN